MMGGSSRKNAVEAGRNAGWPLITLDRAAVMEVLRTGQALQVAKSEGRDNGWGALLPCSKLVVIIALVMVMCIADTVIPLVQSEV